jgi:uncharacterized membrane protein YkgB
MIHMEHPYIIQFDTAVIRMIRNLVVPAGRLALFIIFFWFGFLKVIGLSPANTLVESLLGRTLPFLSFESFIVFLGLWEMLIGISFLIEGWERLAIALMIPHIITTFLPLLFLVDVVWQGFLIPTLEGQYIIKNIVMVALALGLVAHIHPFAKPTTRPRT